MNNDFVIYWAIFFPFNMALSLTMSVKDFIYLNHFFHPFSHEVRTKWCCLSEQCWTSLSVDSAGWPLDTSGAGWGGGAVWSEPMGLVTVGEESGFGFNKSTGLTELPLPVFGFFLVGCLEAVEVVGGWIFVELWWILISSSSGISPVSSHAAMECVWNVSLWCDDG